MQRDRNSWLHCGWLAGVVFALALAWAGAQLEGYEHARHSVGVLGSTRSPVAAIFNATGFELPGALLAIAALALGRALRRGQASFAARIGADLMVIAGVAFAAQGVFPLDLSDGDGAASQRHVLALTVAMIAMLPSMLLLAGGLRRAQGWRALPQLGGAFAALLVLALAWPPHEWLPGWEGRSGFSQRLALLAFFAWPALVALVVIRRRQSPL